MNKLVKQLTPLVNTLVQSRGRNARRSRQRRIRNKTRIVPRTIREAGPWGRALPASYASHVKAAWHVKNMTQTTMHVSGCDLVTPLPGSIVSIEGTDMFLFTVIPSNPAYWSGTRIGQVAPAYMNYRPLRMVFHYIPQVAVTQPGTVIMGTLWNGSSPAADLQQTLVTSNGGVMINCYVPGCTQIQLAGNLQQNLFTLPGDLTPDTNSFLFVAVARGCTSTTGTSQVVPGYFFVEYEYVFKNPIGQAWDYVRSLPTRASDITFSLPNRSIVLLEQDGNYGPGTILDVEMQGGQVKPMYHGSDVALTPTTLVQAFENGQSSTVSASQVSLTNTITQVAFGTIASGQPTVWEPLDTFTETTGSFNLNSGQSAIAIVEEDDGSHTIEVFTNTRGSAFSPSYSKRTWYKIVNLTNNIVAFLGNAFKQVVLSLQDTSGGDASSSRMQVPVDSTIKFALPSTSVVLP